jgi:hypothetical protein
MRFACGLTYARTRSVRTARLGWLLRSGHRRLPFLVPRVCQRRHRHGIVELVRVSAPFAEGTAEQPEIDLRPQRTPS